MTDAELSEIETDAKRIDISWHVAMQLVAEVRRLREIEAAASEVLFTHEPIEWPACDNEVWAKLRAALNPGAAP